MKHSIKLLTLLLAVIPFISCSSENGGGAVNETNITCSIDHISASAYSKTYNIDVTCSRGEWTAYASPSDWMTVSISGSNSKTGTVAVTVNDNTKTDSATEETLSTTEYFYVTNIALNPWIICQVPAYPTVDSVHSTEAYISFTENGAYHFYHSFGVAASLKKKPEPKPVEVVPPPVGVLDKDGDGVLDADDLCPDVAGVAVLQGCPDKDSDGIADNNDSCPDVAGLGKYKGCPIPDTDGDGINDEQDKCPSIKGVARYQGCPVPDTDNDTVNDEEDKCPNRAGPASNQGCPEITKEVIEKVNLAAKNVFFATGSAKLLPKSYKSLDEVSMIMKADDLFQIQIDGHTDAQGDDAKNQVLSDSRAKAVKDYLVSKGVPEARTNATGYGETKPVADNKTAAGRAKNRRVEMKLTSL